MTSNTTTDATDAAAEPAKLPDPLYPTVTDWVNDHFVLMYKRTLGGEFRWCAQWWQHAEAISRFTALWYAWEALRLQGSTGVGIWYRDHLDHQLPILLGPRGPFYQCTETEHLDPHQATVTPPPPDWWDDTDHTTGGEVQA
ncbi:DUF4913 domain-containing protein [Actinomadura scrupuli]|uniref:DUF4913 domain-containing protein n=1 Tax=Actinomadura scrupuli TaxID=559629 RepID=UPI003D95E9EC